MSPIYACLSSLYKNSKAFIFVQSLQLVQSGLFIHASSQLSSSVSSVFSSSVSSIFSISGFSSIVDFTVVVEIVAVVAVQSRFSNTLVSRCITSLVVCWRICSSCSLCSACKRLRSVSASAWSFS